MSFRRTVFAAIVVAVLVATVLEGAFDVLVDTVAPEAGSAPSNEAPGMPGRLAGNRLLLDLLDIPVTLTAALGAAWLLTRRVARPLKQLTAATRQLAAQRFPEPVAVPVGNDELTELAQSFNAMAAALQGFVERERAFTRYASHELRTPLSAIRLQVDRVELGNAGAAEALPALRRHVARMEETLAALLALARSPVPDPERRRLQPLLVDSLAAFPPEDRERLSLVGDTPTDLMVTNARLLQQAIGNLLDNALRHGAGAATLSVQARGRALTLRVSDDGPGVPAAHLGKLTEPFYRASSDRQGLGLGLSFVAFIARALDGDLAVRNTAGGLEATLTLPIVAAAR